MDTPRSFSVKNNAGFAAAFFYAGMGLLAVPAFAKQGLCQKAEPNALLFKMFKRGAYSATVSKQTVKGDEEAEYSFNARRTQRIAIRVRAVPSNSIYPRLYASQGVKPVALQKSGRDTWTAPLPRTGEYLLTISRTQKVAGPSRYAFTVTIR